MKFETQHLPGYPQESLAPKCMVSIKMITYNHEPYIAQAIEGVLMQKTTFKFELVIGEDCSTDLTRKICEDYAKKYPEIIKLLPSEQNLGMIKNGLRTLQACEGKYIAFCEGDDYWTDPLKLQKQVDFLEANDDYGLVHTDYLRYINDLNYFEDNLVKNINRGNIFIELLKENQIATLTVMMRKDLAIEAIKTGILEKGFLIGDYPLWLEISTKSKIGFLKDITAVYRVLSESASHSNDINKEIDINRTVISITRYFASKYNFMEILSNQELLFNKYLLSKGFKHKRFDLSDEAFSFLKKSTGYKIQKIDKLLYIGTYNVLIRNLTFLLMFIKKQIRFKAKKQLNIK